MFRSIFLNIFLGLCCVISRPAAAQTVWIKIPDASQVAFQTHVSGNVYLRNLVSFDPLAVGGDYAYYIDTNTQEGKDIYALFLSYIPQGRAFWLALSAGYAAGPITGVGNW
jgi:hypothetical protein